MPAYGVDVKTHVPTSIEYYWVLKQNFARLKDAIADERSDYRLEYIFGFTGLAIGTARDAFEGIGRAFRHKDFDFWDFIFSVLFFVSIFFVYYFWKIVKPKAAKVDEVISEITEQEYRTDEPGQTS
jgi:hypothetical protein